MLIFNTKMLTTPKGFTLIETAFVIIVLGVIVSILTSLVPQRLKAGKNDATQAIVADSDQALEGYLAAFGRLPCPDTSGDGFENRSNSGTPANFADDTCSAYVGDLPFRTVGLPAGQDSWGSSLEYAVHADLIGNASVTLCASLKSIIVSVAACDTAKLHATSSGSSVNQACLVISSGPNRQRDGLNSGSDLEFEAPDRLPVSDYDDILVSRPFVNLYGRHCTGL
ncbi:MAG: type II secretion system protein [Deltaproteobacteria bacterium]|nr:type II secretion system protein [Deltaproteobacteria bacterium]